MFSETQFGASAMVATVDYQATEAGLAMLRIGGNAADAAVAASAVLAVTTQHMCGMGGDLWALAHAPGMMRPLALNASGYSGSGANAQALRDAGHTRMPFSGDFNSVPVPGCVDGWIALNDRVGALPLNQVLEPALLLARDGFAVAPLLAKAIRSRIVGIAGNADYFPDGVAATEGQIITRPGIARSLAAIGESGRDGWYGGEFGELLVSHGGGVYEAADLETVNATWEEPLQARLWGHDIWTVPPASQGYLTLAAGLIAEGLDLPTDPTDPAWAHGLIEASKAAGFDRDEVLFDGADGHALLSEARLGPRRAAIGHDASALRPPGAGGGTIYLCAVDSDGFGVSLIQSNASGFGAGLTIPEIGVFLQNRGIGFSLEAGHPAEYGPRRRPPSTLAPALATNQDGSLRAVFGTMGGDAQPQVVLQIAARVLGAGQSPGDAIAAPRFMLSAPQPNGFNTWVGPEIVVDVEAGSGWEDELRSRGHVVNQKQHGDSSFGHAHFIEVIADGVAGAADPRAITGLAKGL